MWQSESKCIDHAPRPKIAQFLKGRSDPAHSIAAAKLKHEWNVLEQYPLGPRDRGQPENLADQPASTSIEPLGHAGLAQILARKPRRDQICSAWQVPQCPNITLELDIRKTMRKDGARSGQNFRHQDRLMACFRQPKLQSPNSREQPNSPHASLLWWFNILGVSCAKTQDVGGILKSMR
ncbi:hypothetical protein FRZ44_44850 [Hypericibacter terrae]|uniref:Uncharacterized protein n=1 Tax=Hypericibacter terrae TaxID=2602015 RepID=A0A5J6MNB9_9PROT|nr:hypothetical protein FRZ44_44850 [Hypericibacter terrae]